MAVADPQIADDSEGITVCHHSQPFDVYGGRGPQKRSISCADIEPGEEGWIGNPYPLSIFSRATSIQMFSVSFARRIEDDPEFREAVDELRGKRVACSCRYDYEDEPRCHLDVVDEYLRTGEVPRHL